MTLHIIKLTSALSHAKSIIEKASFAWAYSIR